MARWAQLSAIAAGAAVGSGIAAAAAGRALWDRSTASALRHLAREALPSPTERFSGAALDGLPEPVARYFRFVLSDGQPLIRTARVEQRGEFRIGGPGSPWRAMTAVQQFATDPPGFVWNAALRMAPFLTVRVRDSYLHGAGAMQARLASLIPVVDQTGRAELNAGALQRYLAEAVWFPTALLPGHGVVWQAMDDRTARAILTDAGTTVSLEFSFAESGALHCSSTPERYREVRGQYVPAPWVCAYRSYAAVDGMRVPMEGEVEWILPEGRLPYWRAQIGGIQFQWSG